MLFEPYQPGDRLKADDVNALQDAIEALGAVSQGGGLEGFRDRRINVPRRVDQRGIQVVRLTADVYPEGTQEFVTAYGPFNSQLPNDIFGAATTPIPANAIIQYRNPEANANGGPTGWQDDPQGEMLYVTTVSDTPIPSGSIIRVWYDRSNNRWLPIGDRLAEEIRLNSTTADMTTGYYDAYIQTFDKDSQARSDGTRVWVRKMNSGDTLTLNNNYLGFIIGHKGGRCVYDIVVGGGANTVPYGTNGGTNAINASTWQKITWNAGGPSSWWTSGTDFIVPSGAAGTYELRGSLYFNSSDPSSDYLADFGVNGNPASIIYEKGGSCSLHNLRCYAQKIVTVSVGDHIALYGYHNFSGGTPNVTGIALAIQKVG